MFLQIKTPTGYKDLSTIQVGDKVCAFDGAINIVETIDLWTAEANDYENQGDFIYYLINGTYKFYKNQLVYCNGDENGVHAFQLTIGDTIYNEDDTSIEVVSIEELTSEKQWYRLTISNDHTYILDGIMVHNATLYWVGGGSSANWNAVSNTNWSLSSSGVLLPTTIPTSADDVIFDFGTVNATISAGITILSFTKSVGYTGTITRNAALTVAGNFTDNTASAWAGSSGLVISAASTMTSNGQTWGAPLTFNSATITIRRLIGNWTVSSVSILATAATLNKNTTETLTITNGMSMGNGFNGTVDVILTGGIWSLGSSFACNSLTIAGNVTINNGVTIGVTTITYSSGTVTHLGLLNMSGSCTLNTAGIVWGSITINGGGTYTLSSLLTLSGTLTLNGTVATFGGTSGFICNSFVSSDFVNSSNNLTLVAGVTYTITNAFNFSSTRRGSIQTITSSSGVGGAKAILTLNQGATCNVLANFTRIDASNGRTIRSFNGTITDCLNIVGFTDIGVSGF
jgi:hypothetical protein